MKLNKKRRGIPFLHDFYTTTLLWDKEGSNFHQELVGEIFEHSRRVVKEEVGYAVCLEIRHLKDAFSGAMIEFPLKHFCTQNWGKIQRCIRKNGGYRRLFSLCQKWFEAPGWRNGYGGSSWAYICQSATKMMEAESLNHLMCRIDNTVDACHNNGRALDKLHGYAINDFLFNKTYSNSSSWIIAGAQRTIRLLPRL